MRRWLQKRIKLFFSFISFQNWKIPAVKVCTCLIDQPRCLCRPCNWSGLLFKVRIVLSPGQQNKTHERCTGTCLFSISDGFFLSVPNNLLQPLHSIWSQMFQPATELLLSSLTFSFYCWFPRFVCCNSVLLPWQMRRKGKTHRTMEWFWLERTFKII